MTLDFKAHALRQQKYFSLDTSFTKLSMSERTPYIKSILSYLVEECIEVIEAETAEELGKELSDLYIYYMGLFAVCGFEDRSDELNYEEYGMNTSIEQVIAQTCLVNRLLQEGPHRYKAFKAESPVNERDLFDKVKDLFTLIIDLGVSYGYSFSTMEEIVSKKLNYNSKRSDHVVNI